MRTSVRPAIFRDDEQMRGKCVQDNAMPEDTFPIEFIGGSRDGEVTEATSAPDHLAVRVGDGDLKEIYERQSDQPPFFYVQIGYTRSETWK
jgi:hypothetical protein